MTQSKTTTPEEYLSELDADRREAIERVRGLVIEAAPRAQEGMEHGMLSYDVAETSLVALASQKRHLSLYLMEICRDPEVLEPHRDELANLDMGKGCIRFRRAEDLPFDALREIIAAGARRAAR